MCNTLGMDTATVGETPSRARRRTVSPFYVDLGARMRRVRKARKMSLADVEQLSDRKIRKNVLASYELGYRRVGIDALYGLAGFYGVPVESILPPVADRPLMVPVDELQAFVDSLRVAS